MKAQRFFRYLWRTNAVLIFLATGAVCLVVASVMLSQVSCNARQRRAVEAAPPVVASDEEKLHLGPMRVIEGNVLRGELLGPRESIAFGSGGYSEETRNILYLDAQSTEARWLLPDSARVISEETTVWSDEQDPEARRQVASVALVKLPGADLEVAAGTLVVFDPLGRRVTTVAEDVRTLSHASLLDSDSILLLYERNRRYVRALIDARSFEVRSVDDISVPELE
jgi:hypothetical protein